MDIDSLKCFIIFSETLNFTQAAEKLHISQPALHTKIKNLADYLGKPLYLKQGRQLYLTEEGEELCAFAREICEATDNYLHSIQKNKEPTPVILAAGEGAFHYLLGSGIKSYLKNSKAPLKLVILNSEQTIQAVATGKAHIGITITHDIPDSLKMQPLTKVEQWLVLPKEHKLTSKKYISIKDLDDVPLILPSIKQPHRKMIAHHFDSNNAKLNISVEATGWDLMIKFVELGFGLTIVNSCCKIPKGLIVKPIPELPSLKYQLITRKNARHSKTRDFLSDCLLLNKNAWNSN